MSNFKEIIKNHLDNLAQSDESFAESYSKENKSIDECVKYIMKRASEERKNNEKCLAVSDEEVFGWAIHYYDEDDVEIDGDTAASVSVSTSAQPTVPVQAETEEPKPKAKRKSRKKVEPKPEPKLIEAEAVEAEAEENVAVDIQAEESADDEFEIEPLEIPIF